ncbi:hypothetical protein FQN54_003713 [Arachnomyces sp. PD_36]|nr:hypothetical protein FQN54_003713 [Arachnomyces sp. PD_36]
MFGTLQPNEQNTDVEFVQLADGFAGVEKHAACQRCRAKKVKCDGSKEGCRRCRSMGKSCTYAPGGRGITGQVRKHRANSKLAEYTINFPVEPQQEAPSRSSATSSSKTTGDVEYPSNANPITTSMGTPPDSLLSELFSDSLNNMDFDSSVLTSHFSLEPSNKDTDPMLTHFALFPASREPPSTMPTSSSPEANSYFSSGQQLLSPCTMALTSPFAPTTPPSCQCLEAVVTSLDRFDSSSCSASRAELDSIIAFQKHALASFKAMLSCTQCTLRRENIILLVFMSEKIAVSCDKVVALYIECDGDGGMSSTNHHSNTSHSRPGDCRPGSREDSLSLSSDTTEWQELFCGDYEINSKTEWNHLVRVLIILQLQAFASFLSDMKRIGGDVLQTEQVAKLLTTEKRVGELIKKVSEAP